MNIETKIDRNDWNPEEHKRGTNGRFIDMGKIAVGSMLSLDKYMEREAQKDKNMAKEVVGVNSSRTINVDSGEDFRLTTENLDEKTFAIAWAIETVDGSKKGGIIRVDGDKNTLFGHQPTKQIEEQVSNLPPMSEIVDAEVSIVMPEYKVTNTSVVDSEFITKGIADIFRLKLGDKAYIARKIFSTKNDDHRTKNELAIDFKSDGNIIYSEDLGNEYSEVLYRPEA